MNRRLQTAMQAARAAGKILRTKYTETREIRFKGKRDIVTDADYAADYAIRKTLLTRFPGDRFLSEEDDAAARQALWAESEINPDLAVWIVDPLDGTTNYAHHYPIFSVSIALYQAKRVQAGVIYDPIHNELYAAERGKGATANGHPIAVSPTPKFDAAVIGLEWARAQDIRIRTTEILAQMVTHSMTARSTGSAALSLCNIAAGRLDVYFHLSLSPWDVAAGALIVEEAGGCVTSPAGQPWTVHSQSYLATNGLLHKAALRFFRPRQPA